MNKIFPLLDSLKGYNPKLFRQDLAAGLTVGVMLIPQGMAYAMIAGLPPEYGLYAAIFPTIIYAIFGSSRQLSVGPVAMDSLLVAAGIGSIAVVGSDHYIVLVILLAFMIGVIQMSMGLLRLGFIVNFLSKPVIHGFTFGAAIIIAVSQMKHLLGVDISRSEYFHDQIIMLFNSLGSANSVTLFLGLGATIFLLLFKYFFPKIPAGLLSIIIGIGFTYSLDLESFGVSIVGDIPGGFPSFGIPNLDLDVIRTLLPIAGTLALIGFMEAYSIGLGIQSKNKGKYELNANRELIAIGLGNVVGSFFRSFPTTGGFSRTAVNNLAGAQTGIASIISATIVVLTLLFFAPSFYYLPTAVLGAIIFVAVLGLIDLDEVKYLWNCDRYDFGMLLTSFFGTLFFGIEMGIGLGVLLSMIVMIFKTSTPHMAVLGRVEGTDLFRNLDRFDQAIDMEDTTILRFDARLYFANTGALKSKIDQLVKDKSTLKKFVLDAQSISDVDSSGLMALSAMIESLNGRGIAFHIVGAIGPVRDKLYKSGLVDKIGVENIHNSIIGALSSVAHEEELAFQTNEK